MRGINASDVMIPRIDIVSVAMSDNFNEIVKQLIKTNHSRVPVRNESLEIKILKNLKIDNPYN